MRKKIVFITASVNRGGASRVLSIIANHYSKKGWDVSFLVKDRIIAGYELEDSIKIKEFGKSGENHSLKFYRAYRKYLKNERPDVIVSFISFINIYSVLANRGLGARLVISERNDPQFSGSKMTFRLCKFFYAFADCIVFQSKKVQSYYSKKVINKSAIVLNPVSMNFEKKEGTNRNIVTAGRFVEQKNHRLLLEAFAEVNKMYPESTLTIYGDGELRDEYLQLIDLLDIQGKVFLPGNIPNLHQKMEDSYMFVISSDYEGLSNSLLEAMAMGFPCISTKSGGAEEIIVDGVNGLLVDVGDRDGLAKAINSLFMDSKLYKKVCNNAKDTYNSFKTENVIKQWEKIIENEG